MLYTNNTAREQAKTPDNILKASTKDYSRVSARHSQAKQIKGADQMGTMELAAKVKELREMKDLAKDVEAAIAILEAEIKAEMAAQHTEEIRVGEYKVRWQLVISNRFDNASFKKAMPELFAQYTKPTEAKRFSIA